MKWWFPRRSSATRTKDRESASLASLSGKTWRNRWIIHPFLIGLFPILSLYSHNVYETPLWALLAPIGLTLAGAAAVWGVLRLVSRDPHRAGLATSLTIALFFSFDLATRATNEAWYQVGQIWVSREHHIHPAGMLALMMIVALPAFVVIFRFLKNPAAWTSSLNLFALILIALPTSGTILARVREPARPLRPEVAPAVATSGRRPDIYYIVLDGFARSDVLADLFGLDVEPFLRRLENRGFFVARRSTSNYCQTRLSIASSLNFDYLDKLVDPSVHYLLPLSKLIKENLLVKTLRPRGYKLVSFATGFEPTDLYDADVYLYPHYPTPEFHRLLIDMTPLAALVSRSNVDDYQAIRERTLFLLDRLPTIARIKGPTFTFAHIVCPHPPFVFGEHGEDISPRAIQRGRLPAESLFGTKEYFQDAYRQQSIFIAHQVEQTIDRILAASPEPPIILLQSDHGSWLRYHPDDAEASDLRERFGILSSFYLPGPKPEGLTDHVSPVNSFRIVLNHTFGTNLPLLEDRNYFSPFNDPLDFSDVTERVHSDHERTRSFSPPLEYPSLLLH